MTVVSLEEFRANVDAYVEAAASGDVILTRDGKPCALLCATPHDLSSDDEFSNSPEFWRMINQRRREAAISWDEALKQLEL